MNDDYYNDYLYYKNNIVPALEAKMYTIETLLYNALNAVKHLDSQIETVSPKQGSFVNWVNTTGTHVTKEQLMEWYEKAEARVNAERIKDEREAKKVAALAKLSNEEKELLGL